MRFPRNAKIFRGQFDAAPVASVFFLLVLFLLMNTSLVFPPGVRMQLPRGDGFAGNRFPTVVVALDVDGHFYYEHQAITEPQLRARLREAVQRSPEPLTLLVQADQAVKLAAWVSLAQLAREVGLAEAMIAVRPAAVPLNQEP
jgi:biopolymer transport protein ExbD